MPHDSGRDWSDSDPSFIRPNAAELFDWARRLGLSNDQLRDAVDGGLIRPTGGGVLPAAAARPAYGTLDISLDHPDTNA